MILYPKYFWGVAFLATNQQWHSWTKKRTGMCVAVFPFCELGRNQEIPLNILQIKCWTSQLTGHSKDWRPGGRRWTWTLAAECRCLGGDGCRSAGTGRGASWIFSRQTWIPYIFEIYIYIRFALSRFGKIHLIWREECHLSLVTTQEARCIGNMNGVAGTSHFPPYWLWRRPADLPSFKQASIRLAQRMLLLKMIVDVEPGFAWLPCPFLMGLLDDIPSGLEENSICKIEGLEKCLKLQKSWLRPTSCSFHFNLSRKGTVLKGIRHSYSAVEKSHERETAEILTESRTNKF